ncbi:MAG: methyltransferase [Bacteroidetes bacterium]|nr:MAG: methyltransferase [Bacteroidota bacterium]
MKHKPHRYSLPPRWIVKTLAGFRSGLFTLHQRLFPGSIVVYEKFQYLYLLPCLHVAAELNVAGLLQNGNRKVENLASETNVNAESLYRVLRVLASHGIFREHADKTFSNTRLSRPLMEGPESLRHMLRHHLGPLNWAITGELLESVRTGTDGFNRKYGKNIYDYLAGDSDRFALFDQSMADLSSLGLAPLLQAYSFSQFTTLADIGGGDGASLISILQICPNLRGILFDLPAALTKAKEMLHHTDLENLITLIEGNFMEAVPSGADGYLLKHVLHNWDDQHCVAILSNIRKVMPEQGKLIVVEMLVPPGNRASVAKMIDIQMLTSMPGGRERTRQEFEILFSRAGLSLTGEYPTVAPFSVLEAGWNR